MASADFPDQRVEMKLGALGYIEADLRKGSTQDPHDGQDDIEPPNGLVLPPAHLSALARLSQVNSTRRSIIEAITRNTVALGAEIVPQEARPEMPKAQEKPPEPAQASPIPGATPPGQPNLPKPAAEAAKVPGAAQAAQAGAEVAGAPGAGPNVPAPQAAPIVEPEPVIVEPTEAAKEAARAAQRAYDAMKRLDELAAKDIASDSPTFLGLLAMVKTDEEECGNGAIEVSRNAATGEIDGLYYAPGARVRRRFDRDGYAVIPEFDEDNVNRMKWYANFGSRTEVGEDGKVRWLEKAVVPAGSTRTAIDRRQNELLVFRLMANSESRDYGLPRDVAMIDDYVADRNASTTNVNFFENSGVPPTLVFIGGEVEQNGPSVSVSVPDDLVKKVAATLRSGGDSFQGRVGLIPTPPGAKATAVNLAQDSSKDSGHTTFRSDVVKRCLSAFRVQPIFIGLSGEGTLDAEVQRAITLEQVFDPEQQRYERRLTATILREIGYPDLKIRLKRMAVEDAATARESSERSAEVGAVTNAEFRKAHGYDRLVEDGVRVEEGWNDSLVKVKEKTGGTPNPTPRVNGAEDQRGEKPGVGGRVPRGTENPDHARRLSVAKTEVDDPIIDATSRSVVDLHRMRLDAIREGEAG